MYEKMWTVEAGGRHEVLLRWSYWGGAREVLVDGEVVDSSTVPMRWKSTQRFEVGGQPAVLTTKPTKAVSPYFRIGLTVAGAPVESSSRLSGWERA